MELNGSMSTMAPLSLAYSEADSLAAYRAWGANCGPHALAAAAQLSLTDVRGHLHNFKGWMSPTMIGDALRSMSVPYELRKGLKSTSLCQGINRIQWEGSWLNPGVPVAAAYAHTHWVAHFDGQVLCAMASSAAWISIEEWRGHLESLGKLWYVTHHYMLAMPVDRQGSRPEAVQTVVREVDQARATLIKRQESLATQQALFE